MGGAEWLLEVVLVALLAITLFHAVRLERALAVLRRDRSALEGLVAGFNASTRQAESGIERLRAAADGAGLQVARQIDTARTVQSDLAFMIERGERLADRLDGLVRAARPIAADSGHEPEPSEAPRLRSQAERDLLKALRLAR
jgi:hypothetical protein